MLRWVGSGDGESEFGEEKGLRVIRIDSFSDTVQIACISNG
jgi:hypothetical protein